MPSFNLQWNNIPHTDLSVPQGKWRFPEGDDFGALMFQIVATSRQMGISIREFLELPSDEKAMQMAYSQLLAKMDSVNNQEREDALNKQKARSKKR